MPDISQPNQTLITGRTAYGWDGTNAYPVAVTQSGSTGILKTDVRSTPTIQTDLFAAATVGASTEVLSSTINVSGMKQATLLIFHGRQGSTAFGTNGTEYRIEVSAASSGNDSWIPIASVLAGSAAAQTMASSGSHAAAAGTVTILSGTAANTGGIAVFTTGTIEWMRIVSATGTASFNTQEGLTYAHAAGTISDQGELFPITLSLQSATRLRTVINNRASGTTAAIYSRVAMISGQ